MLSQYLTRKTLVERARQRGVPLSIHGLNKDCASGVGPRISARFGRKVELYTEADADAYLATKINPVGTEAVSISLPGEVAPLDGAV